MKIDLSEVKFNGISVDDVGRIFFWKGKVMRSIKPESIEVVREMFSCGLVDDLESNSLFPKSVLTDYHLFDNDLVVEHEEISPVIYSSEWSFSMLQDVALMVLKVNKIARKHGFQTKDCHTANILFDHSSPKFIDLGSFIKLKKNEVGWLPEEDFWRIYYYPLKMWSLGASSLARTAFLTNHYPQVYEYLLYFYTFLRFFKIDFLQRMVIWYFKYRQASRIEADKVKQKLGLGFLARISSKLLMMELLPWQKFNFTKMEKKILRMKHKVAFLTEWGNYQEGLFNQHSTRLIKIAQKVKDLNIFSLIELGGNQGFFAQLLLDKKAVEKVICTDYDERSVDVMYKRTKKQGINLNPAIVDFIFPDVMFLDKRPAERFTCEAVAVLAVIHHLILRSNISLDYILNAALAYTSKYILIEFMPLGLYSDNAPNSNPTLPSWYTTEWFRQEFSKFCEVVSEEQLEKNRILFIGKKR